MPAKPKEPKRELIKIDGAPTGATRPRAKGVSTSQYWMSYYRTHDEDPKDLREKATFLNFYKKSEDVEAALKAYLTFHKKLVEPWMYEALALAIKMNHGSEHDFKIALGYAADLAEQSRNPNHLISVADLMLVHGEYDRVGKLLDLAAEKVPHRSEPLLMMMKLAQKTHDPKRMALAIDGMLALGWPGFDEQYRREARTEAESLAKSLREEKRDEEADALMARLAESESRDVFVRLTWLGDAGLSLAVEEPLGATARDVMPRTVFGGAIVKGGYGAHPESIYVCPRGFEGKYTVRIETIYNNPEKPALEATLEIITHEGTPQEQKETRTIRLGKSPEPVVVALKGGRRTKVMPFLSPQAVAAQVAPQVKDRAASKDAKPSPKATGGTATGGEAKGGAPGPGQVKGRPR